MRLFLTISFKMKAKEIGDLFSTQKFSIGVSSAGINAKKVPEGNFGCFWTVQFWLLFSNLASKIYFEHIVGTNMLLITECVRFKITLDV